MAQRQILAGLLQYSRPLYDQIEGHLLKIYAALFVGALEATIKSSAKKLDAIKETVRRVSELSKNLQKTPSSQGFEALVQTLMPLALAGVLKIDLKELAAALEKGDSSKVAQLFAALEKEMAELKEAAEDQLDGNAKGMRKDLERWKEYYDGDVARKLKKSLDQGKTPEPLTIKLTKDQFPFLEGKFEDNVRKVRGEDAGLFDKLKEIKVVLAPLGRGNMGLWNGEEGVLVVGVPELAPLRHVLSGMRQTVRHELTHATQTVMADALGVKHLRVDAEGNHIPVYRPGPGMGPKETLDPEIHQAFANFELARERIDKLKKYQQGGTIKPDQQKELDRLLQHSALRKKVLQTRGLETGKSTYSLDDLEFYTHLADRIGEFDEKMKELDGLTPEQKQLARDLWVGRKWVPQGSKEEALAWITENDPANAVWPSFSQGSPYFRHLKKYQPEKYKKAVKEFVKSTERHLEEKPEKGLEKLWEEFIDEVYSGGKKKVPNPNSKTRELHPEITVGYLMRQTDPAYGSARTKVRRQFARWRAARDKPASIFTKHFGARRRG